MFDIAWLTTAEGKLIALMHKDGATAVVGADTGENAARKIESVAISEFGIPQDDARAWANEAVATQAIPPVIDQTDHVTLLQEQLDDEQNQVEALTAANATLTKHVDYLESELAGLKAASGSIATQETAAAATAETAGGVAPPAVEASVESTPAQETNDG